MKVWRWVVALPLSVALHLAALLALIWVISWVTDLPIVFVDLTTLDLERAISSIHAREDRAPGSGEERMRATPSRTGSRRHAGHAMPETTPVAPAAGPPSAKPGAAAPGPAPMAAPNSDVLPPPSLVIVREERPDVPAPATETRPSRVPGQAEDAVIAGNSNPRAAMPAQTSGPSLTAGTSPGMDHEADAKDAAGRGTRGGSGATGAGSGRSAGGEGGSALVARGGGAGGSGSEYGAYLSQWRRRIHENVRYPLAARRRGLTGTVQLDIVIQPSGAVASVQVAESSSHGVLDEAAMEAVRRLAPLPFPSHLTPRSLRARLPVVFDLQ